MLTEAKKKFIEFMMSADVLRFGDFTTKSGRKTPYFVNTGNYKTGMQNSRLGEFYAALVKETVGDNFDAMFGPAYKGIPLATSVSGVPSGWLIPFTWIKIGRPKTDDELADEARQPSLRPFRRRYILSGCAM